MILYRLCKSKYSHDLTGSGAEKTGGRWNSKGIPVIYTCESRALCVTEIAVHTPLGLLPKDYEIVSLDIPDEISVFKIREHDLPAGWRYYPHPSAARSLGDGLFKNNKFLIIKAPSVVVPGDFNFLINPRHQDSFLVKITSVGPFEFEKRLFAEQDQELKVNR